MKSSPLAQSPSTKRPPVPPRRTSQYFTTQQASPQPPPRRKSQHFTPNQISPTKSSSTITNTTVVSSPIPKRCMSVMMDNSTPQSPEVATVQKEIEILKLQKRSLSSKTRDLTKKNDIIQEACQDINKSLEKEEIKSNELLSQRTIILNNLNAKQDILEELLGQQEKQKENLISDITMIKAALEKEFELRNMLLKESDILKRTLKDITKTIEQETSFVTNNQNYLQNELELVHKLSQKLHRPLLNSEADSISALSFPSSFDSDTANDDDDLSSAGSDTEANENPYAF